MSERVLFTEAACVFADTSAVVQAFAGRVELTVARGLRTSRCEVIEEFPALSPQEACALADNLSHAARRDPYRTPQPDDGDGGFSILRAARADFTCAPLAGDPGGFKLFAVSAAREAAPGQLFSVKYMRAPAGLKLADALRIGASCAESGEAYARPKPEAAPEPQRIESAAITHASRSDAITPHAPRVQSDGLQPNAENPRAAVTLPSEPRIHPRMVARLARAERLRQFHNARAAPIQAETPGDSPDE